MQLECFSKLLFSSFCFDMAMESYAFLCWHSKSCLMVTFSCSQILSYLLLSASSSAAFRVDDWQSNWGKDKFPDMAKTSVALSFIAFVSMAASSVLSGYALCTLDST